MSFTQYWASGVVLRKPAYGFRHHGRVPVMFLTWLMSADGLVLPKPLMHQYPTLPPRGLADGVALLRQIGLD